MKNAKNVNKKRQNIYLHHILHVQHQKFPIFIVFFGNCLFWVNSKMAPNMAAILNDVTGPPAAQQPIICTSSCRAHHRRSTKGEIFSKYCNTTKTQEGGFPPPCTTVGVWLCLYVRGLIPYFLGVYLNPAFNRQNTVYQFSPIWHPTDIPRVKFHPFLILKWGFSLPLSRDFI